MFSVVQKEISQFVDRGLDRSLRLAVTGLSKSGKTAFITSLINQLININQVDNTHLALFDAARENRILAVKPVAQLDLSIPRFEYERHLAELMQDPPQFPQSTRGVSEIRLAIRYRREKGLISYLKETGTLYLDILDYPGEWLLDLPLLSLSYQQWSFSLSQLWQAEQQKLAQTWLSELTQLDLYAPADEVVLAKIASAYTDYLHHCKTQGLHFIQPGRFVLPGELAGAPVLQFFPLLHLTESEWQKLQKEADANSYFAALQKRYDFYVNKVAKGFYRDYFVHFDRQVILADCLTPLNHSCQAFIDMQHALTQLFSNFHYGKRNLLTRLFSPTIDKLMFIATKADHITSDQMPNLVSLMHQLVQEGGRYVEFEGIETQYSTVAAIRATKQMNVSQNGQQFKAIQGIRSTDLKQVTIYPGSVPSKIPNPQFWQNAKFEFDQFEPPQLQLGENIPHLRMDAVLQFLLADKLQ